MARATTYDFTVTAATIIRDALLKIGAVDKYNTISPQDFNDALRALNMMVKSWGAQYSLWRNERVSIPLHSGKQSYSIGPTGVKVTQRPLRVMDDATRTTGTTEIPVRKYSREEYFRQPLKSSIGDPVGVYYDPQLDNGVLYIWPAPATALTSLNDGSSDLWAESSTSGEYYYTGTIDEQPDYVFANSVELTTGALGTLAVNEWAWGDNDGLGSGTIYIKASADPDSKPSEYYGYVNSPTTLNLTIQRPFLDFDDQGNNPDFPQEWFECLVYNLAVRLSPEYSINLPESVSSMAGMLIQAMVSFDTDDGSLFIQPDHS